MNELLLCFRTGRMTVLIKSCATALLAAYFCMRCLSVLLGKFLHVAAVLWT